MNSHQEAHQVQGHGRGARSSRQPRAPGGNLDRFDGVARVPSQNRRRAFV